MSKPEKAWFSTKGMIGSIMQRTITGEIATCDVVPLRRAPDYNELKASARKLRNQIVTLETDRATMEHEIAEAERQIEAARADNDEQMAAVRAKLHGIQEQIVALIAEDGIKGEIVR